MCLAVYGILSSVPHTATHPACCARLGSLCCCVDTLAGLRGALQVAICSSAVDPAPGALGPWPTWVVEARHKVAALRRGRAAVHAQVGEAAPVEVVADDVQGARHGAEQQHLWAGPGGMARGCGAGTPARLAWQLGQACGWQLGEWKVR